MEEFEKVPQNAMIEGASSPFFLHIWLKLKYYAFHEKYSASIFKDSPVHQLGLKIAKVIDSELILDFNLKPLPKILFYRDGVPIMFDGTSFVSSLISTLNCSNSFFYWYLNFPPADHIEDQDIIIWMEQSRDSPVQILTDVSFEHLTQALSGATTGDWMIGL